MLGFIRIILLVLLTVLLFWAAGFAAFAVNLDSFSSAPDTHTDAVVVLTGGPDRINAGLDLLADGKAETLFISGVNAQVTEKDLIALWRPDVKKPPCCIVLGHKARNTTENAREVREWVSRNPIHSLRLLTTDYHMPRAALEFKFALPSLTIINHAVPAAHTKWGLIFAEYNKTIYTFFKLAMAGEPS